MKQTQPQLIVTKRDYQRLTSLIEGVDSDNAEMLWDELDRAQVLGDQDQVPGDVVTMNSTVRMRDERNGTEREIRIVYPHQSDISEGKVSILAPVGMALLGLRAGQEIEWPVPSGKTIRMKVISVTFQPESEGIYSM